MDFLKLDSFIKSQTEKGIPGCAVIVYKDGKEVYSGQAGYHDKEKGILYSVDSLINLYSTTKLITCVSALQLYEQGKFTLNEPVSKYLPEFSEMTVKTKDEKGNQKIVPAKNQILIKHLFTMTAGFNYDVFAEDITNRVKELGGNFPTREICTVLSKRPLDFEPGTHWSYSLCHDVIGALVEVISGEDFESYVQKNILKPLGMNDTTFVRSEELYNKMARQYKFNDEKNIAEEISKENVLIPGKGYYSGGAGLISNATDYIKFAVALANNGLGLNGYRVISKATISLMKENFLDEQCMKDIGTWSQIAGYGYGLGVRTLVDRQEGGLNAPLGEFGWSGMAGTYVVIDTENNLAVFYSQQMDNSLEWYTAPRLKNIVYSCID